MHVYSIYQLVECFSFLDINNRESLNYKSFCMGDPLGIDEFCSICFYNATEIYTSNQIDICALYHIQSFY